MAMENQDRYFVDERGGCVAVRDRENTDPDYPGLHSDTRGVVKYWHGVQAFYECPTCSHKKFSGWRVKQEDASAAYELANKLNNEKDN